MSPKEASSRAKGGVSGRFTPARIIVIVIAILAVVFIFENTRHVKVRLLIPEVTMPLYLSFLAMFVIGVLCGWFLFRRRAR
ncbi:DUF1049 domain-containing protein [Streptomyces lunaelactis]|uniref:DUF1049 domain-containing protein n=1 Tax=Streptomyces lunaelactis TaxID=1535768 RepID=A0A2R4TAV5_9ACTN|nr:LapA family protein [Streptomyces lunaelactis]AVZ76255.1 DUF1049 domain-containing protein [Streptomyces lunaelactis]NUK03920.1 LapA family protein [Streptomyces lunaelactis]NUK09425.1 LapA family protein [Streptomyces lunaelactis]NUK16162.1 LapA family protein [Streptomyces lunaelactis]NUK23244.1 LapA family protein [Streptomyces lunaelactis]